MHFPESAAPFSQSASEKEPLAVFWLRRDLRWHDNAALFHASKSSFRLQPVFIFDQHILDALEDRDDARVTFIYDALAKLNAQLAPLGASVAVYHNTAEAAWSQIAEELNPAEVYFNHDYEPAAVARDTAIMEMLGRRNIRCLSYRDQVVFERNEVAKSNGSPYHVFTPYRNRWLEKWQQRPPESYLVPLERIRFNQRQFQFPALADLGFQRSDISFPDSSFEAVIADYDRTRDIPALENGTTKLGLHLRFGTVSIRDLVKEATRQGAATWLNELIWREFFMMLLWHYPRTVTEAFNPPYDRMRWRNNEAEFEAWCRGETGYPIVDAGMRELNATGFMHNRVRMIAASFLCKHLAIDWRWGEAYFSRRLLDFEQSSNVGNWQWVAGCGTDAAPYFRIFNPDLQTKKFDPKHLYIRKWVPEYMDPFTYPKPIVEHTFARERILQLYKSALSER